MLPPGNPPAGWSKIGSHITWKYFDGDGWVKDRAQAAEVIKPGVGEGSLVWNAGLKLWMYTTFNELSETIEALFRAAGGTMV